MAFMVRLDLVECLFKLLEKLMSFPLRWEKQHTDLRVPSYSLPNKNVGSKIASFDNSGYKSRKLL